MRTPRHRCWAGYFAAGVPDRTLVVNRAKQGIKHIPAERIPLPVTGSKVHFSLCCPEKSYYFMSLAV
jgi:hypothetical protein